ncbi:unnamed protein product [Ixodes persulcatus]
MNTQDTVDSGQEEGATDVDVLKKMEDIHQNVINLVTDEKFKINKETGREILHYFAQLMTIVVSHNTKKEMMKAKLYEREKLYTYADALRVHVGRPVVPGQSLKPAPQQDAPRSEDVGVSSRPKHALLIYLRNSSATASNDIKVLLKKYFNPHTLGLSGVSLREIRDGLAVPSDSEQELEVLF